MKPALPASTAPPGMAEMLALMQKMLASQQTAGDAKKTQPLPTANETRGRECIEKCKRTVCVAKADGGGGKKCGICRRCHEQHNLQHAFVGANMYCAAKAATNRMARMNLELKVTELSDQLARERQQRNRERLTDGLRPEDCL